MLFTGPAFALESFCRVVVNSELVLGLNSVHGIIHECYQHFLPDRIRVEAGRSVLTEMRIPAICAICLLWLLGGVVSFVQCSSTNFAFIVDRRASAV